MEAEPKVRCKVSGVRRSCVLRWYGHGRQLPHCTALHRTAPTHQRPTPPSRQLCIGSVCHGDDDGGASPPPRRSQTLLLQCKATVSVPQHAAGAERSIPALRPAAPQAAAAPRLAGMGRMAVWGPFGLLGPGCIYTHIYVWPVCGCVLCCGAGAAPAVPSMQAGHAACRQAQRCEGGWLAATG